MIFNTKPTLAICPIDTKPEEKTIALGGVPIGSIKAQLAAKAIGIHNCKISNPANFANSAAIGIEITTKAKLDINSVAKIVIASITIIMTKN